MNLIDVLDRSIPNAPTFRAAAEAVCRILRVELPHFTWAGVYMLEGEHLVLEAWNGPQATEHVKIHMKSGICGLAARENRSVVVRDVRDEPQYLACFQSTRAEIVVPIRDQQGRVIGEIDCDSDQIGAFHQTDLALLECHCQPF